MGGGSLNRLAAGHASMDHGHGHTRRPQGRPPRRLTRSARCWWRCYCACTSPVTGGPRARRYVDAGATGRASVAAACPAASSGTQASAGLPRRLAVLPDAAASGGRNDAETKLAPSAPAVAPSCRPPCYACCASPRGEKSFFRGARTLGSTAGLAVEAARRARGPDGWQARCVCGPSSASCRQGIWPRWASRTVSASRPSAQGGRAPTSGRPRSAARRPARPRMTGCARP